MIFYNWTVVRQVAQNRPSEIREIIRYLASQSRAKNVTTHKKYSQIDWSGVSFLVSPEALITFTAKIPDLYFAQYVALASLRKYAEYELLGKLTLDITLFPEHKGIINENPLLTMKDGEVHFQYEGYTI